MIQFSYGGSMQTLKEVVIVEFQSGNMDSFMPMELYAYEFQKPSLLPQI